MEFIRDSLETIIGTPVLICHFCYYYFYIRWTSWGRLIASSSVYAPQLTFLKRLH